jgi:CRISPR-associated protein Csx17
LIANRPKLQDSLRPPPRLSSNWTAAADNDGSPEFRLALALAGLRAARGQAQGDAQADARAGVERDAVPNDAETRANETAANETGGARRALKPYDTVDLTMCAHLGALDPDSLLRSPRWAGKERRAGEGRALSVWGEGTLVDNLCAVAQRRLMEQRRRGLEQVPFDGRYGAASGDIRAFLDGVVDDVRLADLLLGLAWVEVAPRRARARAARRCRSPTRR